MVSSNNLIKMGLFRKTPQEKILKYKEEIKGLQKEKAHLKQAVIWSGDAIGRWEQKRESYRKSGIYNTEWKLYVDKMVEKQQKEIIRDDKKIEKCDEKILTLERKMESEESVFVNPKFA
jgi:predicted RNase H-like nuclease (RuvC/YqgF family)